MVNFCTVTFAMIEGAKRMSVMSFVNLIYIWVFRFAAVQVKCVCTTKGVIFIVGAKARKEHSTG